MLDFPALTLGFQFGRGVDLDRPYKIDGALLIIVYLINTVLRTRSARAPYVRTMHASTTRLVLASRLFNHDVTKSRWGMYWTKLVI